MYITKNALRPKRRRVQPANYATEILKPIIILGQCFGLLPLYINKTNNSNSFKFKWISGKILYTTVVFFSTLASGLCAFYYICVKRTDLHHVGKCIYYTE